MGTTQKRISWGVVLSAITFVAGMQLKGCNAYAQNEHRITAVETRQTETEKQHTEEYKHLREDMREMRDDVRHVNDKLDGLRGRR